MLIVNQNGKPVLYTPQSTANRLIAFFKNKGYYSYVISGSMKQASYYVHVEIQGIEFKIRVSNHMNKDACKHNIIIPPVGGGIGKAGKRSSDKKRIYRVIDFDVLLEDLERTAKQQVKEKAKKGKTTSLINKK